MKSLCLVIAFVLCSSLLFGQVDLKEEIISFTDSTEIMIRNGRKLVTEKTIYGDRAAAVNMIDFLKESVDNKYIVFYPAEELLLWLANSEFKQFLYVAKHFDDLLEGKTHQFQLENVTDAIHLFLAGEIALVKKDLENSNLSEDEKMVVRFYLRYYEGENTAELNKAIRKFKKSKAAPDYNKFLDRIKFETDSGAMNFCLGYGSEFLNGNIAENFDDSFQSMNFELEWFKNTFYYALFFQGSVEGISSKATMNVKDYDLIHAANDDVFSIKYGAKIGKSWVTTASVNFFTYVSLAGYEMKSQKSNFDIPSSESANLKLTSSFAPGLGLSCDIILKNFKNKITEQKVGAWFIRPNAGYDFFVSGSEMGRGGSLFLSVSMGIGLGY